MNPLHKIIYVDTSVGSGTPGDIISYHPLNKMGQLTTLSSGDVSFFGNGPPDHPHIEIGIEIKEVSTGDLFSSLESNRLQATQIPGMIRNYFIRYLLIIGEYRPRVPDGKVEIRKGNTWKLWGDYDTDNPKGMSYAFVEARLSDFEDVGVRVKQVRDKKVAALWIATQWQKYTKPWGQRRGLHGFDTSQKLPLIPDFRRDPILMDRAEMAFSIKGLGSVRAIAAARHFKSKCEMINASIDEWKKVPGIGDILANSIYNGIRRES